MMFCCKCTVAIIEGLRERTEYIDIFLFSAHQSCFVSNVLFTLEGECQILVFQNIIS